MELKLDRNEKYNRGYLIFSFNFELYIQLKMLYKILTPQAPSLEKYFIAIISSMNLRLYPDTNLNAKNCSKFEFTLKIDSLHNKISRIKKQLKIFFSFLRWESLKRVSVCVRCALSASTCETISRRTPLKTFPIARATSRSLALAVMFHPPEWPAPQQPNPFVSANTM